MTSNTLEISIDAREVDNIIRNAGDLGRLFQSTTEVQRWKAECENASARLDLARTTEAIATLLSQHEPVARLGVDREVLRELLAFVRHHDKGRLERAIATFPTKHAPPSTVRGIPATVIPVDERMPTKHDADRVGDVVWLCHLVRQPGEFGTIAAAHGRFDDPRVNSVPATHWLSMDRSRGAA